MITSVRSHSCTRSGFMSLPSLFFQQWRFWQWAMEQFLLDEPFGDQPVSEVMTMLLTSLLV